MAGCYASEKAGKDIQDTSHDVNQGGIHMDNGALGVRRPAPPTDPNAGTKGTTPSLDAGPADAAGTISM